MRYLITGGGGFIGSHLADALLTRGDEVVILDTFPHDDENVRHLLGHCEIVTGNVQHEATVNRVCHGIEGVFHLAAVVGFANVLRNPVDTLLTSLEGARNVFNACAKRYLPTVFTSSSLVYGHTTGMATETSDSHLGPTTMAGWVYSYAKAADECLAFAYHRQLGLPVRVLRLFNVVGPRQSAASGMVLPRFIEAVQQGTPITIHGTGDQGRTFCHVADIVDGLLRAMARPQAAGHVLNLGGTVHCTINDLAEHVMRVLGRQVEVRHEPDPYGPGYQDIHDRRPDLTRARVLLDYAPIRDLDTMIRDTAGVAV